MLQPNYGVQIKENEKVKTGSYAFKEHFQVMSRAEYEAECVVSKSSYSIASADGERVHQHAGPVDV